MSVAETMKNILTESISANISAHNSIYGENATLNAQLEAIKNGDFSFLASTTEVGKTVLSKEEYERNCVTLVTMEDVASLVGNEMDGKLPLKEKVSNLFESFGGSVYVEGFGDIALSNSSIHSEWRHGRTRDKITSFVAIPNVLQNGVVIDIQSKNRGEVERVIFAAPISIGEESYFMGVMIQRDSNSKRLYLHDVVIRKEVSEYLAEHLNTTGPENNENLYMTDVLNKAVAVGYNISQNEQIVNNNGMQNTGNNTSEIVTLKRQRSIYSAFKDTEKVVVGVDCITDGKVVIPKSDAALEAIMAVTDAQTEENGNYSLARVYNTANSVVIEGEPKVVGNDVYVFEIDGNYYACRQKHLEAFNNNGLIIKANTNEKTAWTVHDESGELVALFMPLKTSSITEDMYNSLPYVSEVLAKDDSTDKTSTKELKNQAENDTIEKNNIDSINYSLESDTESIDAGGELNGETNSIERGIREIPEGNRNQGRGYRSPASDISVRDSMVENNDGSKQTDSRRNGAEKSDSEQVVYDAPGVFSSQVEGREETDGRRYLEAVKSGDEKTETRKLDDIIEKFNSTDLKYQIASAVSAKEINKLINEAKKRENRFEQSK